MVIPPKKTLYSSKTFNHPIKACFSNKKEPVKIQTQIINSIFLIENHPVLTGFWKSIDVQNPLPITFGTALIHIKMLKVGKLTLSLYFIIIYQNELKEIRK